MGLAMSHTLHPLRTVGFPSNPELGAERVEAIKRGEYVKRKADASTVYIRGAYDSSSKRYELQDTEDMNRFVYVKRGTVLFVGFTY